MPEICKPLKRERQCRCVDGEFDRQRPSPKSPSGTDAAHCVDLQEEPIRFRLHVARFTGATCRTLSMKSHRHVRNERQRADLFSVQDGLYDKEAVRSRLRELFQSRGRGTGSAVARAVGVTPTSANRWASPHGDCPDPSHWPAIERFFDVPSGDLARAGGMRSPTVDAPGADHVIDLSDLTPAHRKAVEGLVQALLDAQHA